LIGFFANTLPIRIVSDDVTTFAELVAQVRRSTLDALAHQDLPFEKLVVELDVERDLSRSPIFQVLFSMQNLDTIGQQLDDLHLSGLDTDYGRSQFDINLVLSERPDDAGDGEASLSGWFEYNTDLFDASTMAAYAHRFVHVLEQLTADPHRRLDQVDLLGDDERATVLQAWNDTTRELPAITLHQLIAERAAADPERAAVTGLGGSLDGVTWTCGDLLARARRIGHHLRDAGAGPDQLLGVLLHRSPDTLAVLLGILEAGAGYLPLDPDYPSDRLTYMVESSGATLVVTDGELPESTGLDALATSRGVRFVRLDAEAETIANRPDTPLDVVVDPEHLAYAIYTSGSTGLPKGVQIPHRAIVNFLRSMAVEPGLDADDVLLSVTTLSFDIAGLEHFLPLAVGARLVIADRAISGDGLALRDVLADPAHGLTVVQATPATWRMLVDAGWQGTDGLKILCGGEAMPADLARELTARSAELWNVYGPTETTVWSTTRRVLAGDESPHGGATVTVGFPIDNTTVYLLDAHGQPVPPGAVGELLIGGDGLARGYRGRGGLTAERFVPHPFGDGERLYRTGDLARHRRTADGRGDREFLGRIDHQVKVRGFRIELGEIESVLREHAGVDRAVVMARTDGGNAARLVAYVVADTDTATAPTDDALRAHLGASLPEYMVPAIVVRLDSLPLTPNGKVDRKALPAPDVTTTTAYVAPDGDVETTLAAIWAEVLKVEQVGRQDNFFALGGDSILIIQVVTRAKKAGLSLQPRDLFQQPDLAALARVATVVTEPSEPRPYRPAAAPRDDRIDIVGDIGDDDLDDILGELDL
ncbi:MAG: amino acid adenylation domain-containing protein, partial [Acidobacteriota bacterium]